MNKTKTPVEATMLYTMIQYVEAVKRFMDKEHTSSVFYNSDLHMACVQYLASLKELK